MRQVVAGDVLRYEGLYIPPDEVRVLRNAVATVTGKTFFRFEYVNGEGAYASSFVLDTEFFLLF